MRGALGFRDNMVEHKIKVATFNGVEHVGSACKARGSRCLQTYGCRKEGIELHQREWRIEASNPAVRECALQVSSFNQTKTSVCNS